MVTRWAANAIERDDEVRCPVSANDSVVMLSVDRRGVRAQFAASVGGLRAGGRDRGRDHHRGVVLTDRHELW